MATRKEGRRGERASDMVPATGVRFRPTQPVLRHCERVMGSVNWPYGVLRQSLIQLGIISPFGPQFLEQLGNFAVNLQRL